MLAKWALDWIYPYATQDQSPHLPVPPLLCLFIHKALQGRAGYCCTFVQYLGKLLILFQHLQNVAKLSNLGSDQINYTNLKYKVGGTLHAWANLQLLFHVSTPTPEQTETQLPYVCLASLGAKPPWYSFYLLQDRSRHMKQLLRNNWYVESVPLLSLQMQYKFAHLSIRLLTYRWGLKTNSNSLP